MQYYVLGFCFSEERDQVVLIRKKKPEWQRGRMNGVGGKLEANETPQEGMSREFEEETGIRLLPHEWDKFAVLRGPDYAVHVFRVFSGGALWAKTQEEELVSLHSIHDLPMNMLPNLRYLIPLAIDSKDPRGRLRVVEFRYDR